MANKGINGATLKWLAIVTMFIDHFAAVFLAGVQFEGVYLLMRLIGRLAFPIFAFFMIQGYQHTSNLRRYITRMGIFALVSEVPFDLAFYGRPFYWQHQNIFFTLMIGLATLAIFEKYKDNRLLQILALLIGGLSAELLNTDYGLYGVLFIFGLGYFRKDKSTQTIYGVLMGAMQNPAASLAFVPIWFYNGQRGQQNKWFFYIFYPAHLFLFYVLN